MADIIYSLEGSTYFNITNQCPCNCAFCIRSQKDAVGSAQSLWFEEGGEPTFEDIKNAIDSYDFTDVSNVVFCGYGEPTCKLDELIKTVQYLRKIKPSLFIRLNTNGLSDLINEKPTAKLIGESFDLVSISLNEPDSDQYDKITRNIYPGRAYQAMLDFTGECAKYCAVRLTVVDVIGEENIEKSRIVSEALGAEFYCRSFSRGR